MINELHGRRIISAHTGPNGEARRIALPPKWSDKRKKDYRDFSQCVPEDQRHIVMAVTNFAYFHHRIFLPYYCKSEGKKWPHELWPHLKELCHDYQRALHPELLPFDVFDEEHSDIWRVCRVYPNRMLKTATTCYSLPLWILGTNNEARVLIATANKTLGESRISVVKNHIEMNPYFREVFGDLHREKGHVWTADKIDIYGRQRSADNSMAVYGWDGGIEGTGADICIADDVQNFHNSGTSDRRAKQWQWLTEPFERRLDTTTRTLIVIQTRHADDDFAGRIKKEAETGTWDYKEEPAISEWPPDVYEDFIDDDQSKNTFWDVANLKDPEEWRSKLLCGDVLPLETLMSEWKPESGRTSFYRTRLNKVDDPGTKWFPRQLLELHARADGARNEIGEKKPRISAWDTNIGVPEPGSFHAKQLEQEGVSIDIRVISIDTAATSATPGKDPDYTVIQLWGMDMTRHLRILLDMARFRTGSPAEFRRRLKRFLDAYDPKYTVFEENGMARWIGRDLNTQLGYPISLFFKTEAIDVEDFKTLIESGLMLYAWGDNRSVIKMKPFEDELEAYPNGSHDDTLTAAVQAQSKLRPKGARAVKVLHSDGMEDYEDEASLPDDGLQVSIQRLAESLQVIRECLIPSQ